MASARRGDVPISEDLKTFIINLEIEQRRTIRESGHLIDGKIPFFAMCLGQNKLVDINEKAEASNNSVLDLQQLIMGFKEKCLVQGHPPS